MKKAILLSLIGVMAVTVAGCTKKEDRNPELTFIGHASMKIKTQEGKVVYIDPYQEGDYSEEADLILVTHEHYDHNNVKLVTQKESTEIIRALDLHPAKDRYDSVNKCGIQITSVPAYNSNHEKQYCVGYILEFDGVKVYHAGDTSMIDEMKELSDDNITYAFYPVDGNYNMDAAEAAEAATLVGAKVNVPIHDFGISKEKLKETFTPDGALYIDYGSTITLEP